MIICAMQGAAAVGLYHNLITKGVQAAIEYALTNYKVYIDDSISFEERRHGDIIYMYEGYQLLVNEIEELVIVRFFETKKFF